MNALLNVRDQGGTLADRIRHAALATAVVLGCSPVSAFSPGLGVILGDTPAEIDTPVPDLNSSHADRVHQGIVEDALNDKNFVFIIKGESLGFTPRAVGEIAREDAMVDLDELKDVREAHFDNETLQAGFTRLYKMKLAILAELTREYPNGQQARKLLGQALHSLQDFYSHSSWINLDRPGTIPFGEQDLPAELLPVSSITSGCGWPIPTLTGPPLTSGYWEGAMEALLAGVVVPKTVNGITKCKHGLPLRDPGLNKDFPNIGTAGALHVAARVRATTSTKEFIQKIMGDPALADHDDGKCALLGVTSPKCNADPIEVFTINANNRTPAVMKSLDGSAPPNGGTTYLDFGAGGYTNETFTVCKIGPRWIEKAWKLLRDTTGGDLCDGKSQDHLAVYLTIDENGEVTSDASYDGHSEYTCPGPPPFTVTKTNTNRRHFRISMVDGHGFATESSTHKTTSTGGADIINATNTVGNWGKGEVRFGYVVEKLTFDGEDSIPEKCKK